MLSSDGLSVCGLIFPLRTVCVASCSMQCEGMMLSSDGLSVWPHIARTAREMLPKLCRLPPACAQFVPRYLSSDRYIGLTNERSTKGRGMMPDALCVWPDAPT